MKNLNKTLLFATCCLLMACGQQREELIVNGQPGAPGQDGISMGVDVSSIAPSCSAGGSTIRTYVDANRNSELDESETIKQMAVICNGKDGLDGSSVSVAAANEEQCSNGGVVLNKETLICNGLNGEMGPQGAQGEQGPVGPNGEQGLVGATGPQGLTGATGATGAVGAVGPQGPAGANGSVGNLTPVQLCPGDTASFKEYGFVVDNELYAVYFDKNKPIAFLARLSPGNYITTNGSNCTFSYTKTAVSIVLTNNYGTTTVPLSQPANGLACNVYDSRSIDRSSGLNTILTNATPKFSLVINQLDVPDSRASLGFPKFTAAQQALIGNDDYALDCSGFLNVPKSQTYNMTLLSDDGAKLFINNNLLISMDQLQAPASKSASLYMLKGLNKINVQYFQGPLTQVALSLRWSAPEFSSTIVPSTVLTHE